MNGFGRKGLAQFLHNAIGNGPAEFGGIRMACRSQEDNERLSFERILCAKDGRLLYTFDLNRDLLDLRRPETLPVYLDGVVLPPKQSIVAAAVATQIDSTRRHAPRPRLEYSRR